MKELLLTFLAASIFPLLVTIVLIFYGRHNGSFKGFKPISSEKKLIAEAIKNRLEQGDNIIILDIRSQCEYDKGHIETAINIPLDQLDCQCHRILPDKSAEIMIYCRTENHSHKATQLLGQQGYTKIGNFGTLSNWPFPLVTSA